jgi:hypothetical protein
MMNLGEQKIIKAKCGRITLPLAITKISPKKLKVNFSYNASLVQEIKSYEGASWNPENKYWTIDISEHNIYCLRLLQGFVDPTYNLPLEKKHEFSRKLYLHQMDMIEEVLQRKRVIWACEPGTGKTLAAIEVMERIPGLYWIIVPKTAYAVWEYELAKWKCNNKSIRLIMMHKISDVFTSVSLADHLIIDEVHFFKNPSSKRSQLLIELCNSIRSKNGIILPMTGTPAPKDPTDWWVPCYLCQPGHLRESTKAKLKYRLGNFQDMGDYRKLINWKNPEITCLSRRIGKMAVIKLADKCLDLPPIIYKEQIFNTTPSILTLANIIKKTSPRAITALIRLRQFSDGFQPIKKCPGCEGEGWTRKEGMGGEEWTRTNCPICEGSGLMGGESVDTPKDEALIEYLSEDRDRIVIYAGFHRSIDKIIRLSRSCGWSIIQVDGRGTIIDSSLPQNPQEAFALGAGKIAYIGHPTAGGVSITLNRSEIIIFYSNDFNGASRMQAIKRIHRIGTTKAIIIDFLWLPTDRLVLENLKQKKQLQDITMFSIDEVLK